MTRALVICSMLAIGCGGPTAGLTYQTPANSGTKHETTTITCSYNKNGGMLGVNATFVDGGPFRSVSLDIQSGVTSEISLPFGGTGAGAQGSLSVQDAMGKQLKVWGENMGGTTGTVDITRYDTSSPISLTNMRSTVTIGGTFTMSVAEMPNGIKTELNGTFDCPEQSN